MSDNHSPEPGAGFNPGLTSGASAIAEVITVLAVLALVAFAGFVLVFPVLIGDF